jgi:hypothetical protein
MRIDILGLKRKFIFKNKYFVSNRHIMFILIALILGLRIVISKEHPTLRHCRLYGDTYGEWVNNPTKYTNNTGVKKNDVLKHFIGGPPAEALWFDKIWLPSKCSYHRFTSQSAEVCVKHMIDKNQIRNSSSNNSVNIIFIGDSATRGIVCGISRILSGSEVYGPCINPICGGSKNWSQPVGYKEIGTPFTAGKIDYDN